MTDINLDEIVAQREPHKVTIFGKVYFAVADPPVGLLYAMYKAGSKPSDDADESIEAVRRVLVGLFGDQGDEVFEVCGIPHIQALLERLMDAYAAEGKAPGSSKPSRPNGARSRPTSNGSTKSTSTKRASVTAGSGARG